MQTSLNTLIALTVRQLRQDSGLTQTQAAELIGMTNAGWGKIENGQATLSIDNLNKFCNIKQIDIKLSTLVNMAEEQAEILKIEGWSLDCEDREKDLLLQGLSMTKSGTANSSWSNIAGFANIQKSLPSVLAAAFFASTAIYKLFNENSKNEKK